MRRPSASAMQQRKGRSVNRLPFFAFVVCASVIALIYPPISTAFDFQRLKELEQLARSGAPQLALSRIDVEQPNIEKDPVAWQIWERERLQILDSQGKAKVLIKRVEQLPGGIDKAFYTWAIELKAHAQLQMSDVAGALDTVRRLLWLHSAAASNEQLANWRRLIVRSYVLDGSLEAARLALTKFQQDFGDGDQQWRWLNAQVLLRSGYAESALELLSGDTSHQGAFLTLVARLSLAPQKANEIQSAAVKVAKKLSGKRIQSAYWGLAADAAALAGNDWKELEYLERALSLPADPELMLLLNSFSADRLWEKYLGFGQELGNQEQKLIGNDEDWYFPAVEALEKEPLRARLLFSVLATHGAQMQKRTLGHEYLIGSLEALPEGARLVKALYLDAQRYSNVDSLPAAIRYGLIDTALETGDLETASRLMRDLSAPPSGSESFDWELRRARVLIFTGSIEEGFRLLKQLVSKKEPWEGGQIDRYLQVVFDLQTVEYHEQALELMRKLMKREQTPKQKRELLFWMADSASELKNHDQAAYLYLSSATLLDPLSMDPWAQTARYRAAKELMEARLLDDAAQIYNSLLRASKDTSRQAVLRNDLQRLRLLRTTQAADIAHGQ